ncbi:MAG TPA: peptidase MA family metallohydrolase [Elusimicrobiales bacterium]|nr:peptidase MA family metallohydrolase [Elusimicrobiales bacterium]
MIKLLLIIAFCLNSQEQWNRTETAHFNIFSEGKWQITNLTIELERIYNLMNLNLSFFAPWMKNEKTNIYIYSSYENYIKGSFSPPKWSKGLAFVDKKTIVVYDSEKKESFIPTITHELTHLYFESYFNTKLKHPPLWLNEGIAVYMEDISYQTDPLWSRALRYSPKSVYMKFDSFFKTDLNSIKNDNDIANWYLQSYGIVRYMFESKKLIFYKFCEDILNGKEVQKSFWDNYRILDYDDFEKKWFYWLKETINENKKNSMEFKPFKRIEFKKI